MIKRSSNSTMHLHVEGAVKHAVDVSRGRIIFVALIFTLFFVLIAVRLIELSLDSDDAGNKHIAIIGSTDLKLNRASILDRNGILLATNLKTKSLFANTKDIPDAKIAATKVHQVLPDLDYSKLLAKLYSGKSFIWLKRNLHPSEVRAINDLGIPGLNFQADEKRTYPHGSLMSHVLGFVGSEGKGLAAIEKEFECTLNVDPRRKCGKGEQLQLSLDVRVQDVMYRELLKQFEIHKAKAGAGIIMDANSGEIISLVSLPAFNGNNPAKINIADTFNYATKALYEMGSTFKSFTMALALDSGIVKLADIYDAKKSIRMGRHTIRDYHGKNRELSVPEVYMYSSNLGTARIIDDIGIEKQQKFLAKLGLLSELPSLEIAETAIPQYPEPWGRLSMMTAAYGHGISVTAMHVAPAIAALVNGGIYFEPTLIKGATGEGKRVIKEETSEIMRKLMRLVVGNKKGTGKKANAKGYFVGGKTGTADKIGAKRYDGKAVVSSFVGAFPMNNPKYVIMALLDEPHSTKKTHGFRSAGWTVAPVIKNVVEQIAPILGIKPVAPDDEIINQRFNMDKYLKIEEK